MLFFAQRQCSERTLSAQSLGWNRRWLRCISTSLYAVMVCVKYCPTTDRKITPSRTIHAEPSWNTRGPCAQLRPARCNPAQTVLLPTCETVCLCVRRCEKTYHHQNVLPDRECGNIYGCKVISNLFSGLEKLANAASCLRRGTFLPETLSGLHRRLRSPR